MRRLLFLLFALLPACAVFTPATAGEFRYKDDTDKFVMRVFEIADGVDYGQPDSAVGYVDVDSLDGRPVYRGVMIVTNCSKASGQVFLADRDENRNITSGLRTYRWDDADPDTKLLTKYAHGVCAARPAPETTPT